jgi:uncharacterized protein YgiM (DUF1202 family)
MYRLGLIGLAMSILLAGCNLGSSPRETSVPLNQTPTSAPIQSAKPVVTITSPADGGEVQVGKQFIVNATATDPVGVTGVQLLVNGSIVKRVSSRNVSGDPTLAASLDYIPRTAGDLNIQVLAFRGQTVSDPATLSLEAVTSTTGGTTGGGTTGGGTTGGGTTGGSTGPVIPNDGVCRALTDLNLNMRATPITGNVITIIPGGTLAPVGARLGDNSWWRITYANQVGWVSNQFVTMSGNCSGIPIDAPANPTAAPTLTTRPQPTNTPLPTNTPVPGKSDLLVTQIGGEQNPVLGGNGEVTKQYSVTITNNAVGNANAGQFTVSLKVNDVLDEEWTVSGLAAGQSVLLTTNVTFKSSGTQILRVDADTGNNVTEASDVNNTGFYTVTVAQP